MGHFVAQALWLSVAVVATGVFHMVVVKVGWWRGLAVPLDGGRSLGGVRIFGDNKTWRGVVVMTLGCALFGALQGLLGGGWAQASGVACLDFARIGARAGSGAVAFAAGYALVCGVCGLGYVLGELPNSFLKRRIGITPGKTSRGVIGTFFLLLDQSDSVIAALLLVWLIFPLDGRVAIAGVIVLSAVHLGLNGAMYLGKLKKNL